MSVENCFLSSFDTFLFEVGKIRDFPCVSPINLPNNSSLLLISVLLLSICCCCCCYVFDPKFSQFQFAYLKDRDCKEKLRQGDSAAFVSPSF